MLERHFYGRSSLPGSHKETVFFTAESDKRQPLPVGSPTRRSVRRAVTLPLLGLAPVDRYDLNRLRNKRPGTDECDLSPRRNRKWARILHQAARLPSQCRHVENCAAAEKQH